CSWRTTIRPTSAPWQGTSSAWPRPGCSNWRPAWRRGPIATPRSRERPMSSPASTRWHRPGGRTRTPRSGDRLLLVVARGELVEAHLDARAITQELECGGRLGLPVEIGRLVTIGAQAFLDLLLVGHLHLGHLEDGIGARPLGHADEGGQLVGIGPEDRPDRFRAQADGAHPGTLLRLAEALGGVAGLASGRKRLLARLTGKARRLQRLDARGHLGLDLLVGRRARGSVLEHPGGHQGAAADLDRLGVLPLRDRFGRKDRPQHRGTIQRRRGIVRAVAAQLVDRPDLEAEPFGRQLEAVGLLVDRVAELLGRLAETKP